MQLSDFKEPGPLYCEVALWSWNDLLEDDELLRQLDELYNTGWRSFFISPRPGLVTPYLSEQWFEKVRLVVEKAHKLGMKMWIYDENVCPSGFADGIIPAKSSDYRLKKVSMRLNSRPDVIEESIATFKCFMDGGEFKQISPVKEGTEPEFGYTYLQFMKTAASMGGKNQNYTCFPDILNPDVVEAFIETTYEGYKRAIGKYFGTTVLGSFTDESQFYLIEFGEQNMPDIPWCSDFPEYFQNRNGYCIADNLPSLFLKYGNYKKIRYEYWSTITEIYTERFTKKIYKWCEENNLKLAGHFMMEDTLQKQLQSMGSVMSHLQYIHIPGVDQLFPEGTNRGERGSTTILGVKQPASVANQLGRERVFCECFGVTGQNLSFEERKSIGDWLAVLGINLFQPHLSLYSLRGARKEDCPPVMFYQQPWWKYNKRVSDYFSRLSYMLSRGKRIVDTLVLHTISSAWCEHTPGYGSAAWDIMIRKKSINDVQFLEKSMEKLQLELLEQHIDFDLGDEGLIAGHGKVNGSMFEVGNAAYSQVIMPASVSWDDKTFEMLKLFTENGGRLTIIKPLPCLINGQESSRWNEVIKASVVCEDLSQLAELMAPQGAKIEITGDKNNCVWYQYRSIDDKKIVFLANVDRRQKACINVRIPAYGKLEEWDLFTGKTSQIETTTDGTCILAEQLVMYPRQSRLLVLDESKQPVLHKSRKNGTAKSMDFMLMAEKWDINRANPNVLAIDTCRLKYHSNKWTGSISTLEASGIINRNLPFGSKVSVVYSFNSILDTPVNSRIFLALEMEKSFEVRINGRVVDTNTDKWWVDISFKKVDITDMVKQGENTIEIVMTIDMQFSSAQTFGHSNRYINDVYILGDFGVYKQRGKYVLRNEDRQLIALGNLKDTGYPYYTGSMLACQNITIDSDYDGIVLEIGKMDAILVNVKVNGLNAGMIFAPPYQLDLTSFIKKGGNFVEFEVVNSLRNLLGSLNERAVECIRLHMPYKEEARFIPYGIGSIRIIKT